jgi:hypothetical protein
MPSLSLKTIDFEFPFGGIFENAGYSEQPEGTSPSACNVRGYDISLRRKIGCQRQGTTKIPNFTSSTYPIDLLISAFIGGSTLENVCYLTNGKVYTGNIANGTASFTEATFIGASVNYNATQVSIAGAYDYFWMVNGTCDSFKRIDPITHAITIPSASSGSIPSSATIIALYHGRLFHAGFPADPFNYWASRVGDPLDYYVGSTDVGGAFSGNDTPQAGLLGDRITAMIPYNDQRMVIGMATSLAVMRGDPKAGGDVAFLSREVGIVNKNAWARSPEGALYFLGADGLYVLTAPDRAPKCLSRKRLDATLGHIDHSAYRVSLSWDPLEIGVKILIVPRSPNLNNYPTGLCTMVFYEERSDTFWYDAYYYGAPNAMRAVYGTGSTGPILAIGCYDGYMRLQSGLDDDGAKIQSWVYYTPIMPYGPNVKAKLVTLRTLWDYAGGVWQVRAADDPISVLTTTNMITGTVTASGYQTLNRDRVRGAALVVRLSSDPSTNSGMWRIDRITGTIAPSGRVRA